MDTCRNLAGSETDHYWCTSAVKFIWMYIKRKKKKLSYFPSILKEKIRITPSFGSPNMLIYFFILGEKGISYQLYINWFCVWQSTASWMFIMWGMNQHETWYETLQTRLLPYKDTRGWFSVIYSLLYCASLGILMCELWISISCPSVSNMCKLWCLFLSFFGGFA